MKSFLIALQFLSRIQLAKQTVWTERDFGKAVQYFPLVGLCIGLILYAAYTVTGLVFEGAYRAVIVLAVWLWVTGGLHADGYMDTADGIFSGRDRERMLEILKDSRVGANGVMAFVFLILLKITFLAHIPDTSAMAVLIGIPTAARFGSLISIFEYPYARETGLGKYFAEWAPSHPLVRGVLPALLPVVAAGPSYLVLLGIAMILSLAANTYISGYLGGVTGDTYGAVIEWSEMMLLGIAAVLCVAVPGFL